MGTAMAYAYKTEGRSLDSKPYYKYATGTLKVKYIKPTPNKRVKLIAKISETSVSISLQSVTLKAIAEVLANPTCRVSFTSVIVF